MKNFIKITSDYNDCYYIDDMKPIFININKIIYIKPHTFYTRSKENNDIKTIEIKGSFMSVEGTHGQQSLYFYCIETPEEIERLITECQIV